MRQINRLDLVNVTQNKTKKKVPDVTALLLFVLLTTTNFLVFLQFSI